jgi:hypothetical protein
MEAAADIASCQRPASPPAELGQAGLEDWPSSSNISSSSSIDSSSSAAALDGNSSVGASGAAAPIPAASADTPAAALAASSPPAISTDVAEPAASTPPAPIATPDPTTSPAPPPPPPPPPTPPPPAGPGRDEDLLSELLCPISQEPMWDPVVAADGNTYQRAEIAGAFPPSAMVVAWGLGGWPGGCVNRKVLSALSPRDEHASIQGSNCAPSAALPAWKPAFPLPCLTAIAPPCPALPCSACAAAWIARQTAAKQAPCSPLSNLPLRHLELEANHVVRKLVAGLVAAGLLD